jgi:hypothetical protein
MDRLPGQQRRQLGENSAKKTEPPCYQGTNYQRQKSEIEYDHIEQGCTAARLRQLLAHGSELRKKMQKPSPNQKPNEDPEECEKIRMHDINSLPPIVKVFQTCAERAFLRLRAELPGSMSPPICAI